MSRVIDFDTIVTAFRADDFFGVDSEEGGTAAISVDDATAEIRAIRTGTASPSTNAAFIGQWHVKTNATLGAWVSVQTGAGTADWLKLWSDAADIPNGTITNAHLAGSIDASTKLADGSVTNGKLATGISGAKLTDGSVPIAKLESAPITSPLADDLNANSKEIQDPVLVRGRAKAGTVSIASGAVEIPFDGVQAITLTSNVTNISFSNIPPAGQVGAVIVPIIQDGTGGRTVGGWPSSVYWVNNDTAPSITSTANKMDLVAFMTWDGGSKVRGLVLGQNTTP